MDDDEGEEVVVDHSDADDDNDDDNYDDEQQQQLQQQQQQQEELKPQKTTKGGGKKGKKKKKKIHKKSTYGLRDNFNIEVTLDGHGDRWSVLEPYMDDASAHGNNTVSFDLSNFTGRLTIRGTGPGGVTINDGDSTLFTQDVNSLAGVPMGSVHLRHDPPAAKMQEDPSSSPATAAAAPPAPTTAPAGDLNEQQQQQQERQVPLYDDAMHLQDGSTTAAAASTPAAAPAAAPVPAPSSSTRGAAAALFRAAAAAATAPPQTTTTTASTATSPSTDGTASTMATTTVAIPPPVPSASTLQRRESARTMLRGAVATLRNRMKQDELAKMEGGDDREETTNPAVRPAPRRVDGNTLLHTLCAKSSVSFAELEEALADDPTAASVADKDGRLPLHILGSNEMLLGVGENGQETATAFGLELMRAYPEAITTLDHTGRFPFVEIIENWIKYVYETYHKSLEYEDHPEQGGGNGRNKNNKGEKMSFGSFNLRKIVTRSIEHSAATRAMAEGTDDGLVQFSLVAFPNVQIFEDVEWCFKMLSAALDGLGGRDGGFRDDTRRRFRKKDDMQARADLVMHLVTRMPTLLKTVLLIEDDGNGSRERVLGMSVFRRVLLCPDAVGKWSILMLQQRGTIAAPRGVQYLKLVSSTTVDDYDGGFSNTLASDVEEFEEQQELVFQRLSELNGTITSLLVLDESDQERAVTASVVWYIMKQRLLRPFLICLTLADFMLHLVMLLAYRTWLAVGAGQTRRFGDEHLILIELSVYYLTRKCCESISIFSISRSVFLSYITNLWTLVDILTVTLVLISVRVLENPGKAEKGWSGFYALVVILLWTKVLSFLKVVNQMMATFIIALIRIVKDLKSFALVLFVTILMFGDAFFIAVRLKDSHQFCENAEDLSDPAQDFCSNNVFNAYFRVYALLLGDFELNDYRDTNGMLVLFFIFSMIGMIVMLNLLIAVMSTSYEEAMARSLVLFGRARITFVAETYALERFLRPDNVCEAFGKKKRRAMHVLWRVSRWVLLMGLMLTAISGQAYLYLRVEGSAQEQKYGLLVIFIIMFIVLLFASSVILMYSLEFWTFGILSKFLEGKWSKHFGQFDIFEWIATKLFGLDADIGDFDEELFADK